MSFSRISVVGLGYIGLPTAAMFASRKLEVIGLDVNPTVVDTINAGRIHIVEPALDILVRKAVEEGYLKATLKAEPAEAFLIAVPTPLKDSHEPDLSFVEAAAKAIAPVLEKGNLVVLESTSPVGATEQMSQWLADARPDLSFPQHDDGFADVRIAHCPERVLPGNVIRELVENDRIIGGITKRCSQRSVELYRTFVKGECLVTDARTAEMTKLTENSFRDVNIAFANELSILCDRFGIDVQSLINLANHHPRVNILQPGTGVGGHCIAIDPWFIVHAGDKDARIIRAAREINDDKTEWVVERIISECERFADAEGHQPKVACMGLAFKPNIDDLRESPALKVFQALLSKNINVVAVEPNLDSHSSINLTDLNSAVSTSDIVTFLVGHDEFRGLSVCGKVLDFCGVTRV